jgi:hypothetical protein
MRRRVTVVGVEIGVPPGVDVIPRFQFVPLDLVRQQTHFLWSLLSSPGTLKIQLYFWAKQSIRERERERRRKKTEPLKAIASFA